MRQLNQTQMGNKSTFFFAFVFIFFFVTPSTSPGFTLKPALNWGFCAPQISPENRGVDVSKQTALLGGLLFELPLFPFVNLDSGALLHPYGQSLKDTSTQVTSETKWKQLLIPVGLRLRLIPFFNLGLGGYYGVATSSQADQSVSVPGLATATSEVALASEQKSDYGLYSSVSVEFSIFPSAAIFVDGRYLLGLKNQSASEGSSLKFNHFQFLSGLSVEW